MWEMNEQRSTHVSKQYTILGYNEKAPKLGLIHDCWKNLVYVCALTFHPSIQGIHISENSAKCWQTNNEGVRMKWEREKKKEKEIETDKKNETMATIQQIDKQRQRAPTNKNK